ncbi:MAG: class I SAM-dependent methyltransferase [Myxococcaceae bacterium]
MGTQALFDRGAPGYDFLTSQPIWRGHCREMAALVPGARVLDLGIGPGVSGIEMARAAPGTLLVGLDFSAGMLSRARKAVAASGLRLPLVRADATHLPFRDGSFDGATGHSFLYLLDDADAVLREVHRAVRPGGRVAFLEPSSAQGLGWVKAVAGSFGGGFRFGMSMALWGFFSGVHGSYTPESLAQQLTRCGFRDPQVSSTLGGLGLLGSARRV